VQWLYWRSLVFAAADVFGLRSNLVPFVLGCLMRFAMVCHFPGALLGLR
jgi:hypothetical protein